MPLELLYRYKWHKSLATKEQAKEGGLSIREAEHCLDAESFLNEYLLWEVGGLHCPIILQEMFVHAAELGQKEAERLICWGHWQGLLRLNPEADVPAIQLVGYWISQKKIWDLDHEVYMLKDCLACQPVGPNRCKRPSKTSYLPWGAAYKGEEVPPSWGRTKGGLPWPPHGPAIKLDPTLRAKGWTAHVVGPSWRLRRHTGGHWSLPTCWS